MKTVNYCHKELIFWYCGDPISASESYNSHQHSSTKTWQTNGIFSLKLDALHVSLSRLSNHSINLLESYPVEEHETKL